MTENALTGALSEAWSNLRNFPARSRQFRTQPLTDVSLDVYAALRAGDDAPCLLLRGATLPDELFEVGGMRLSVDRDERGTLLILSLEDTARIDLFTMVCADAISTAGADAEEAVQHFLERLDAWRRFLKERHSGLSREEVVGLIGELLVLERLLSFSANLLENWKAPDDGLHDFERDGHSLEIKTGLGAASLVRISSLDQLDTAGIRRLDLGHVRLVEDPTGRTLLNIVEAIDEMLADEAMRRQFANGLLRRGLMPDDSGARGRPRIRLRSMDFYAVTDEFPRLLRSSVPAAVAEASYALELRAIASLALDAEEAFRVFAGGRSND